MSLLWGLYMYWIGTWTLKAKVSGPPRLAATARDDFSERAARTVSKGSMSINDKHLAQTIPRGSRHSKLEVLGPRYCIHCGVSDPYTMTCWVLGTSGIFKKSLYRSP